MELRFRAGIILLLTGIICKPDLVNAQTTNDLPLSEAIKSGLQHYQSIQAKRNYMRSSDALLKNTKNEYLPNVIASLQQDYGTVNGQYGPLAPSGAQGVSSSGPAYSSQSWNAAFGANYLLSTNWEFFTFGRLTAKIRLSQAQVNKDSADLAQEEFVASVKISASYLDLLAAQKLVQNATANLSRAVFLQQVVLARTRSGLNAGVDSSIANAQVSSARLTQISAEDYEQQVRSRLAQLMNADPMTAFNLDTTYFTAIPAQLISTAATEQNPQVKYYQARIDQSTRAVDYLKKSPLPGLNLFGIFQSRGSGFSYNYSPVNTAGYTKNYLDGINPVRSNYVTGIAVAWNMMSIAKIKEQVAAQRYLTRAYQDEYDLINTQLKDQLILSEQRIANSLRSFTEAPVQYKAAADAYNQKNVLYKNGLTNIVDLQQALYALNKAETDRSIAYINVWQALLLKAAASGDFNLFLNQVK
jgi:outer membrane protein TolC